MKTKQFAKIYILMAIAFILGSNAVFAQSIECEGTITDFKPREKLLTVRTAKNLLTTFVITGEPKAGSSVVSSYSILPGDRIDGKAVNKGKLAEFKVDADFMSGELLFMDKEKIITDTGRQIYFSKDATFFKNGAKCAPEDIKAGNRVFLRVDPITRAAGCVEAIDLKTKQAQKNYFRNLKMAAPKGIKSFKRGQSLEVLLNAAPKSNIVFDISGIARGIPLKEIQSGLYKGRFTFQRGDARYARLIIRLPQQKDSVPYVSPQSFDVAVSAPKIKPVFPVSGVPVNAKGASIFAEFASEGSLIDASSITVYLDGKPVGESIFKNVEFVRTDLPDSLPAGNHRIKVVVSDSAGNTASKEWDFQCQ